MRPCIPYQTFQGLLGRPWISKLCSKDYFCWKQLRNTTRLNTILVDLGCLNTIRIQLDNALNIFTAQLVYASTTVAKYKSEDYNLNYIMGFIVLYVCKAKTCKTIHNTKTTRQSFKNSNKNVSIKRNEDQGQEEMQSLAVLLHEETKPGALRLRCPECSLAPFEGEARHCGRFCPMIGERVFFPVPGCRTQCTNWPPTGQQAGQAGHQSDWGNKTPELPLFGEVNGLERARWLLAENIYKKI